MEAYTMGIIRNIAFLDARNATEESLKHVTVMENIATLICSDRVLPLLEKIRKEHIANMCIVPSHVDLDFIKVNGSCTIDEAFLDGILDQAYVAVNGHCIVKDIDMEIFRKKIYKLAVNGTIECPDHIKAGILSKSALNGSLNTYPRGYKPIWDTMELTEHKVLIYDHEKICVEALVAIEPIDYKIEDYFERIKVMEKLYVTRSNLSHIKGIGDSLEEAELILVPEESLFRRDKVKLKPDTISTYSHKTLIVDGSVHVEGLTKEQLEEHIEGIFCDIIYCESKVENAVRALLRNDASVKLSGSNVLHNMGKMVINQAYIDGMLEKQPIENMGKLEIDEDVNEDAFAEKIASIENMGKLIGRSTVLSKVPIKNLGKISYSDKKADKDIKDKDRSEVVLYEKMGTLVL